MLKWIIILILLLEGTALSAQTRGHDMVSLRNKQGRTVKTYFNGVKIDMGVNGREVEGLIRRVQDDTIFIQYYDVRKHENDFKRPKAQDGNR